MMKWVDDQAFMGSYRAAWAKYYAERRKVDEERLRTAELAAHLEAVCDDGDPALLLAKEALEALEPMEAICVRSYVAHVRNALPFMHEHDGVLHGHDNSGPHHHEGLTHLGFVDSIVEDK